MAETKKLPEKKVAVDFSTIEMDSESEMWTDNMGQSCFIYPTGASSSSTSSTTTTNNKKTSVGRSSNGKRFH